MSKLEELIQELCPDGVECKPLENCCNILDNMRKPVTKGMRESGIYPYYGANGIQDYVSSYIFDGKFILVGEDGSVINSNGNPIVNWVEGKIWVNNHAHIVEEKNGTILKYLYYYIQTINISNLVHGNIPKLTGKDFRNLKIPVPPLEVQEEIVRILDNFTELTTELTTELNLRKKQYEYYRDKMFEVKTDIPVVKLKDIATDIYRGSGIKRDEVTSEGIPCVRYGEIYTTYNTWFDKCVSHTKLECVTSPKYFENGDILFAITGESIEDISKSTAYVGHEKCLAGGDIVVLKHNQNPKYLSYALSTENARKQKGKGKVKSKVVHSSVPDIEKIEIPLPPLDVQERIVNVLDNFEKICSDLQIGLPAEIDARQKQYEYYRDLLLNFDNYSCSQFVKVERESLRENNSQIPNRADIIKMLQYVFGYVKLELGDVIYSLNTGLNPRQFFKLNTDDATNYYITIREIQNGNIVPTDKTDHINDDALLLCNNRSNLEIGDVLFSGTGTIGETAVIKEKPDNWNIKEGVYAIKPNNNMILSEFLKYLLDSTNIKQSYMKKAIGGTVKSIPMGELRKIEIPVPTIKTQEKLVMLINRFDSLCNDITKGLPAEIDARQKQYEYYRDKLLNFKELKK